MITSQLKNEFREKFKKADSLLALRELSEAVTKEDFIEFSNSAMLDAYRSNRVKAVEFMLSFYEKDNPILLLKIHLYSMLSDEAVLESGKKMLIPLVNHFSDEICHQTISHIIDSQPEKNRNLYKQRETEILKIIKEKELPEEIKEVKPTLLEIFRTNQTTLKNEFRERMRKSDILKELKELSENMSEEEFKDFSDSAIKSAYDSNRVRAVTFMLSFYEKNTPELLMRIHLARMLADQKDFDSGKKMLISLSKNFSYEFCDEVITEFMKTNAYKKHEFEKRKSEIFKIILEQTLTENNKTVSKKLKL
jgi:hypothetical protein